MEPKALICLLAASFVSSRPASGLGKFVTAGLGGRVPQDVRELIGSI
jgi:hypothetical protein